MDKSREENATVKYMKYYFVYNAGWVWVLMQDLIFAKNFQYVFTYVWYELLPFHKEAKCELGMLREFIFQQNFWAFGEQHQH